MWQQCISSRHIIINKTCFECIIKQNISFLPLFYSLSPSPAILVKYIDGFRLWNKKANFKIVQITEFLMKLSRLMRITSDIPQRRDQICLCLFSVCMPLVKLDLMTLSEKSENTEFQKLVLANHHGCVAPVHHGRPLWSCNRISVQAVVWCKVW